MNHAGEIHHFGQAAHRRIIQQRRKIIRIQHRAAGRHVGGGDAAGGHEKDAQRQAARAIDHEANARQPSDVRDFVRISDDRRHAARYQG